MPQRLVFVAIVISVSNLSAHNVHELFICSFSRTLATTASASTAVEMPAGNRVGQTTDEYVAIGGGSGSFVIFAGAQNVQGDAKGQGYS